jgi:hypothetical protein
MNNTTENAYKRMVATSIASNKALNTAGFGISFMGLVQLTVLNPLSITLISPLAYLYLPIWFAIGFYRESRDKIQQARNEVATDIFNRVNDGRYFQEYVLYLRPFITSGKAGFVRSYQKAENMWFVDHNVMMKPAVEAGVIDRGDMELQFGDTLWSSKIPLIALSETDRKEGQGAGRIQKQFGADWLNYVSKLAENAKGIIVTLASDEGMSKPGTINEIKMLRNKKLLDKTLFFVPALTNKSDIEVWEKTRNTIFKEIEISLPNYKYEDFSIGKGYFLKYLTEYSMFVEIPVDSFKKMHFPWETTNPFNNIIDYTILMDLIKINTYKVNNSRGDLIKLSLGNNIIIEAKVYRQSNK